MRRNGKPVQRWWFDPRGQLVEPLLRLAMKRGSTRLLMIDQTYGLQPLYPAFVSEIAPRALRRRRVIEWPQTRRAWFQGQRPQAATAYVFELTEGLIRDMATIEPVYEDWLFGEEKFLPEDLCCYDPKLRQPTLVTTTHENYACFCDTSRPHLPGTSFFKHPVEPGIPYPTPAERSIPRGCTEDLIVPAWPSRAERQERQRQVRGRT